MGSTQTMTAYITTLWKKTKPLIVLIKIIKNKIKYLLLFAKYKALKTLEKD